MSGQQLSGENPPKKQKEPRRRMWPAYFMGMDVDYIPPELRDDIVIDRQGYPWVRAYLVNELPIKLQRNWFIDTCAITPVGAKKVSVGAGLLRVESFRLQGESANSSY